MGYTVRGGSWEIADTKEAGHGRLPRKVGEVEVPRPGGEHLSRS